MGLPTILPKWGQSRFAPLQSLLLLTASSSLSSTRLHHLLFRSPFSSSSSSHRSISQKHCCDQVSDTFRISVWWDLETCPIANGVDAFQISNRILIALESNGIRGPIYINAFGNMLGKKIPNATQVELCHAGIPLTHLLHSEENSENKLLRTGLNTWTRENSPPAHFFLISNDSVFSTFLDRLRMNNYNVLLSCSHNQVKASLYGAVTLMWPWISLAKGEDFTPLQLNHPPDGMYASWKGLHDDPFEKVLTERVAEMNTPTNPELEEENIRIVFHTVLCAELNNKTISEACFRKYTHLINAMPYSDLFSLGKALKIWLPVKQS